MKFFKHPSHPIYLLSHAIVFISGILFIVISNSTGLSGWTKLTLFGVGTSLVAAGITGWVVYTYVKSTEQFATAISIVAKFGILNVFSGRSVKIREEYDGRMRYFKKQVDILGFGLNSFRQDNLSFIPVWKQQGSIRILLIDPEFPNEDFSFANQRDREENDPLGTISRQVRQFASEAGKYIQKGRFEIRLYKCLPMLNIYRIDDEILWGPYLIKESSRNTPTFLVRSGGEIFERIVRHFETIWNDDQLSREVPISWYQE